MRRSLALAACLGSLSAIAVAIPAHAQVKGDRPGITYREVERGPWVSSTFGAVYYVNLPGEGAPSGVGSLFGLEAGYDISKFLQLGVVVWGQSVGAPSTYRAITDDALNPKRARGDFQTMMAGASVRLAFLRFQDDNGQDRTFFYARAAGGPTLSRPIGIVDEQGFFAAGGVGVEYFTRLRHFSVGIELDGMALLGDADTAVGLAVLPHAKYTF